MRVLITISFLLLGTSVFAQIDQDRIFHKIGSTAFFDIFQSPVHSEIDFDVTPAETSYSQNTGVSFYTIIYNFRYNFFEPQNELAISGSIMPAVGLSFSDLGVGSINLPLMANIEFGAGSTYKSRANLGGFFGVGLEYQNGAVFFVDSGIIDPDTQRAWVQPVAAIGLRRWNRNNVLKEYSIKFGMGPKEPYGSGEERSTTLRIDFKRFINY